MMVAARSRRPAALATLMPSLRATVAAAGPDVPASFRTMPSRVVDSFADRRFTMAVLSTFALVALLLAAVGIYGVLSQTVVQRTAEIGVRMALGAEASAVRRMIVGAAMGPVLVGIACGSAGATLGVRLLRGFLYGVTPLDPVAFGAAAAVIVIVALVAAFVPARRATRIDPLRALRAG
jgi:putative ABC transport system permease protein